jgi:hypothetical protein
MHLHVLPQLVFVAELSVARAAGGALAVNVVHVLLEIIGAAKAPVAVVAHRVAAIPVVFELNVAAKVKVAQVASDGLLRRGHAIRAPARADAL